MAAPKSMWCALCGNSAVSRAGEICAQCRSAEYEGPDPEETVEPDTNDPSQFPAEGRDLEDL